MGMQFRDSSDLTGLVEDIDFLCGTDSTSYPLKDKARNGNRWLYKAVIKAMKANKKWRVDDSNLTTLPEATSTLVNGQRDYSLPTDILTLERVTVKDTSSNDIEVFPIDIDQIPLNQTDGFPTHYALTGNSIIFSPAPATGSVTLTNGYTLYYSREVDAFASTDTTQESALAEPFQRIVSLGASYDWLLVNGTNQKAVAIRTEIEQLMGELVEFYADRNKGTRTGLVLAHKQGDYI